MTKLSEVIIKFESLAREYRIQSAKAVLEKEPNAAIMLESTATIVELMNEQLKKVTEL